MDAGRSRDPLFSLADQLEIEPRRLRPNRATLWHEQQEGVRLVVGGRDDQEGGTRHVGILN